MLQTMPHLNDDKTQQKECRIKPAASIGGTDSPQTEELPIQVAIPYILGTSDPIVAMGKNEVSTAVVGSSFDSQTLSSPPPRYVNKGVITPSSSIGRVNSTSSNSSATDDISSADTECITLRKIDSGPISTSTGSEPQPSHSPILVKRQLSQISQTDDEEVSATSKEEQDVHGVVKESSVRRPAIIRRGSSLISKDKSDDMNSSQEGVSKTIPEKIKCNEEIDVVSDNINDDRNKRGKIATNNTDTTTVITDGVEKKENITLTSPGEKGDESSNGITQHPKGEYHPHHMLHPGFLPTTSTPHAYHPHSVPHGSYPYGTFPGYPPAYSGYPPHVMASQFHGHPAAGFYPPYPPGYHHHALHQQTGIHLSPFAHIHNYPTGIAMSTPGTPSEKSKKSPKDEVDNCKQIAVLPSMYKSSSGCGTVVEVKKSGDLRHPTSANRCVPLQEPIPSKHWGKPENTENKILPDFHQLVNYPDYLSKSRSVVSADGCVSGGSKSLAGKKHCVMCGKLRICSASSFMEKGRAGAGGDDGTAHIIPRQNKGLCTACDVTVWVLVADGLEIKWCKGCKNFRQWAAFGDKGSATKCVRCRERQREKYAMQKNAKRARRTAKTDIAKKSVSSDLPFSSVQTASLFSKRQQNGPIEEEEDKHFTAARGLTSLMNAAAAL